MDLNGLVRQAGRTPEPWVEGRTIPWNDPEFSRRMLAEHLSQAHDAASRRGEIIDQHVEFLQSVALPNARSRILDLGCGPGFYVNRFAALGHECVGIDFAPAAIEYARANAIGRASFVLGDIREVEFGAGFDLVMLLFGELNLFSRHEAVVLLQRCAAALAAMGRLVLEVHSQDLVRKRGQSAPVWRVDESGLFSERPHLRLDQSFWLEPSRIAAGRHWIIEAATGEVRLYGWCMQAYTDTEYEALLDEAGLAMASRHVNLNGTSSDEGFPVLIAKRGT